jgi:hypothetical protein
VGIIVLPALLVLLSAALRSFIINKDRSTMSTIGDIGLGLPVDLTFAAFSVIIYSNTLSQSWINFHPILIVVLLIVAVIQLGAIYKPCKEYRDESENLKAFGLWFINILITFFIFSFIALKVIK